MHFNNLQHYRDKDGLDETARQLAIFIAKTGFSDVEWRNMPLIDDAPEFQGPRRVALIDLEEMEEAAHGIFGGAFGRRGLIRCLASEQQIDIALAEAHRLGVVDHFVTPAKVKARRMEEIQDYQQLQQFYARNGILRDPRQPIVVEDLSSLGLDLEEQGHICIREERGTGTDLTPHIEYEDQQITMRDAVTEVIGLINEAITRGPEGASTKGKRYILLNTNDGHLQDYNTLGIPEGQVFIKEGEENKLWLRRIINALVEQGHLFKLIKVNGHGYFIQA